LWDTASESPINRFVALEAGDIKANCFSEDERIAFSFTNEVMDLFEATDATYAAVKKNFSDRAITEMLYVIGTYMLVVRVLRTGRVPLDDEPAASPTVNRAHARADHVLKYN
jgi:alkylhydroperoxidase family enzyme